MRAGVRVGMLVGVMGLVAACGDASPTTPPSDTATEATVSPGAPAPAVSPTTAPAAVSPSAATCTPASDDSGDLLVRYVTPGTAASAQVLGAMDLVNCRPTIDSLRASSPAGSGSCTQVAYARDNPGYDVNADPAPPLRHMIAEFGDC
jgi:hypothetical protein